MALTTFNIDNNGWIYYGSLDDSVVYRNPMTSLAAMTAPEVGTALELEVGSGTTYDAVKGMNPGAAGGWRLNALVGNLDLHEQGQAYLEIEKGAVCHNDPTNGSVGEVYANQAYFISMNATTGGAQTLLAKTTGGALTTFLNNAQANKSFKDWSFDAGTAVNALIHSGNKDDFVKVNIGWNGGQDGGLIFIAVDGVVIAAGERNDAAEVACFADIYLGSDRGVANSFIGDYFMRNFQLSTRAPVIPVLPKLSTIGILSDSIFNTDILSSVYRDTMTSHVLRGEIEKRGFRAGNVYVDINGGYTIDTTGANDLFDSTNLTALQAAKPSIVVIRGGTNDVIQDLTIDSTWDTNLKANLTTILGYDGVEKIFIGTIPSLMGNSAEDTEAHRALKAIANAFIKSLPLWNSNVIVYDLEAYLGGENTAADTFIGQLSGLFTDLHLAGVGLSKHGKLLAETIVNNLD